MLLLLGGALLMAALDRFSGQLMGMDVPEVFYTVFGDPLWDTSALLDDGSPRWHPWPVHRVPRHAVTGRGGDTRLVLARRMGPAQTRPRCSSRCEAGVIIQAPWLARLGDLLRQHAKAIRTLQWLVVGFYLTLLVIPAFSTCRRPQPACSTT